ncbi:hypothetical protein QBC36DRAFT_349064 [Triangularia setosa]|uniref:Uncharacterized protein n=1 Tax=Triangularia setosa TaxID=2587417 RepID=A0AAN6W3N9_9PEZI|nr:hypothetical protein QBC36DRAFT_349064 [Podospora setosa]
MGLVYPIVVFGCHNLVASCTAVFGVFKPMRDAGDTGKTNAKQTAEDARDPRGDSTYTCIVDPSFRTWILDVCKQNGH